MKPTNIIFHNGIVKILDFGLSKVMETEDTNIELTSQGVGTYWYLPPEAYNRDDPKVNNKVDVWSVGVIMFEMLFGRRPFGHGIPQHRVENHVLNAFKVDFPS